MRPLTVVQAVTATVLLTLPSARAADLTGVISDYLLRKVPPTESRVIDMTQEPGTSDMLNALARMSKTDPAKVKASMIFQMITWQNPARLNAEALGFFYLYKLGPDYWTLVLKNARQPLSDYVGTTQVRLVGQTKSAKPLNIYRVEGGRFGGFLAEDGTVDGTRLTVLMTPQTAAESKVLAQYLK